MCPAQLAAMGSRGLLTELGHGQSGILRTGRRDTVARGRATKSNLQNRGKPTIAAARPEKARA